MRGADAFSAVGVMMQEVFQRSHSVISCFPNKISLTNASLRYSTFGFNFAPTGCHETPNPNEEAIPKPESPSE